MTDKETYFAKAIDWDTQSRLELERRASRNVRIAWACGILCGLSVLSVTVLLPLKQFVPAIIRVDNATGAYDVQAPGESVSVSRDRDQKILLSDVARYVLAREGFTRGEAESNYKTAYLMSCGPVRADWENYFNPEVNPQSPVKTMTPTDSERAEIQNITFLPTDQDELRVAQVRFDKTVTRGVTPPTRTRFISTLTVRYDRGNVPSQIRDLHVNAFGFCAVNYRRDQEGVPQVLGVPMLGAVGQGGAVPAPSAAITPANIGKPQAAVR
ncbi:virB8 family protein [Polaromonas sp.]|uniref:virB8 family protein n=1 Tax=Polaromonas sp. TaxID=1869339 RepID=UPI00352B7A9B